MEEHHKSGMIRDTTTGHTGHSDPQSLCFRITRKGTVQKHFVPSWISSQEAGRWEVPAKLRSDSGHESTKRHENRGHGLYRSFHATRGEAAREELLRGLLESGCYLYDLGDITRFLWSMLEFLIGKMNNIVSS